MSEIKLIHPKTGVVREIDEKNSNKLQILKRAGFVLAKGYKMPVKKAQAPDPSLAEVVEGQRAKMEVSGVEVAAEVAIHKDVVPPSGVSISKAAQKMVDKHDLDLSQITGTGREGQITKTDVKKYLEALEDEEDTTLLGEGPSDEDLDTETLDAPDPDPGAGEALTAEEIVEAVEGEEGSE